MRSTMMIHINQEIPHFIKYMGSKKKILHLVVDAINDVYNGGPICDLFAGTSILSGSLRDQVEIISNDIQEYSSVLAKTYLENYNWDAFPTLIQDIVESASIKAERIFSAYSGLEFDYNKNFTLKEFNNIEEKQRQLIEKDFSNIKFHLFTKYYSGTYWSFNQCVWIDAIRETAEEYSETPFYNAILASLMFAMSYNSQSTGHYAQYRDATNKSSMEDILIYRRKEIIPFFVRKLKELRSTLGTNRHPYEIYSLDYRDCLELLPNNSVVYADPPYAFVHYSRFYHAIETLVRYDYPNIQHKGRYRDDRHQSPFCIKSKVQDAFQELFLLLEKKQSNLVLSYSNTGMIELDDLIQMAENILGENYRVDVSTVDYLHSTMGRREDKSRKVQEALITAKRI